MNFLGTSEAGTLNGRVLIDSLSFTQNFDLASLAGQVQSGGESAPNSGMADRIKLDIAVETSRDLNLASSEVSLQGQANLRVVGTAADPVIVGRTEFTGGDIFLMNKRYQIERGIIAFSNPNRTEPVLNVLLTTTMGFFIPADADVTASATSATTTKVLCFIVANPFSIEFGDSSLSTRVLRKWIGLEIFALVKSVLLSTA